MTKEQEKVIECFKEIIKQTEEANECGLSTNDFSEEIRIYYEVLNLIQQLQKELEKKEYLYHKALSELVIADKKNIEKDKIIDEMAEWIFDKDYNENSLFIDRDDYYSNCIKQVKQYFEKKVREE